MEFKVTSRNERETIQIAQNLESEKFENMIICLEGDLGSGKTVFAKGFAGALGIERHTSPCEAAEGALSLLPQAAYR